MYTVFSFSKETSNSDEAFSTVKFSEAVQYCKDNLNDNYEYVIYDSEGVVIWDTYDTANNDYGKFGT